MMPTSVNDAPSDVGCPNLMFMQPLRILCERTVRYPMPNKPTCVPQGHHTTSLQFTFNIQLRIPFPLPPSRAIIRLPGYNRIGPLGFPESLFTPRVALA
jgi:hypothetical protein